MTKRSLLIPTSIVVLAALIIVGYSLLVVSKIIDSPGLNHLNTSQSNNPVPDFRHIVVIVMENHGLDNIIGNADAPYLNKLAVNNSLATNYYAAFHPSLPNYLVLTSGTNAGITTDCSPGKNCLANVKNIADEIETSGRTWKAYEENMPSPCTATNSGLYAVRHDPFVYYPDISSDKTRCQNHVVPYSQLSGDLAANKLPNYSFITPNICDDMHNCSVSAGDNWLKDNVPKLLDSKAFKNQNSLLVITFDEAEGSDNQNKVPTILVGRDVQKHFKSSTAYSHFALLHTIESAWGLDTLTSNDLRAPIMTDFFTTNTNE